MAYYNRILILMLALSLIVCMFSFSASAAEIDDEAVIVETTDGNIADVPATEEDVVETENTDLAETNFYLKYITGILIFFLVCFLFWACYRFLGIFF